MRIGILASSADAHERRLGTTPTMQDLKDDIEALETWVPCRFLSLRAEDRVLYLRVEAAGKVYEVVEPYPRNSKRHGLIRRVR